MTVQEMDPNSIRNYKGLSTDTKPTTATTLYARISSTFFETDTGKFFIHNGTSWVQISNN